MLGYWVTLVVTADCANSSTIQFSPRWTFLLFAMTEIVKTKDQVAVGGTHKFSFSGCVLSA
jgi:hypothetical protein